MDNFTEPLMEAALAKRNLELAKGVEAKVDHENDNLLAHLVRHTQGSVISVESAFQLVNLLAHFR